MPPLPGFRKASTLQQPRNRLFGRREIRIKPKYRFVLFEGLISPASVEQRAGQRLSDGRQLWERFHHDFEFLDGAIVILRTVKKKIGKGEVQLPVVRIARDGGAVGLAELL